MHELLDLQHGVVARRQLTGCGLSENDVRRLLRRRELVPLHPGVYVDHTGPPTWMQRAWGGVLLGWPAALAGASALRADDGPGRGRHDPILVAIEHGRTVQDREGVRFQRVVGLDARVRWNLAPPRVRYEDVARPHGLPRGERQVRARASTGVVCRDTTYPGGVVLELDRAQGGAVAAAGGLARDSGRVLPDVCGPAGSVIRADHGHQVAVICTDHQVAEGRVRCSHHRPTNGSTRGRNA